MKAWRVILHSLVLTAANISSIILAFGFYYSLKQLVPSINQVIVQAPLAALFSIVGYMIWIRLANRFSAQIPLKNNPERWMVFVLALLWTPVIFIPLHYITQGYLTSVDNILVTWLFQIPVNLLAIWLSRTSALSRL